ncbi:iron ABC transporter permease [Methylorubrum populi]|uniref:Iron ABC transporter permease n=1 Tax=Methylorubrum rhodesianum TaxID=29427 RepID=A0ABU9ZGX0_9HYPH|nr:iron chelate uptake ABC transporter family permease subunit [Methylorubrum rhodesianum]MBK3405279.1 iron ABC transporter permease [Methylorubrum rhodesianum]MBY0143447.1 iron ABC transporter permease [Methylorubrum populi]MRI55077.1 iron ABC transporter permease [Methylobacterium sp. DB1607]
MSEAASAAQGRPARRRSLSLAVLLASLAPVALLLLVLVSLGVGRYPVPLADVFSVLVAKVFGQATSLDPAVQTVVLNVRLPRVFGALVIGAGLAAAGATYQGLFRNPLVSPDILGVSAGASLGAVLGIVLALPVAAIQGLAFAGGLAAVGAVYAVGLAVRRHDPVLTLVLAGVAVGALLGAGISLLKVLADPYNQLPAITFWLLGSLASVNTGDIAAILPATALGLVPLVLLRWRVNLMSLGDEEARALGLETRRLRPVLVAGATLVTAAAVSVTGVIGWIGLIVPHVARLLVGPDFRRLLPASMLLGAGYLTAVDLMARTVAAIEVPLGILTALVGAPFFLWLLAAGKRGWA